MRHTVTKAFLFAFLLVGGLCILPGRLLAANEDRSVGFGASAAVIESKIRDQAEEQLLKYHAAKLVAFEEAVASVKAPTGPSFFLKKVILEGDVMLDASEYEPLFQKYEGREVGFEEIQTLTNALEQLFRAKGYIAVILLPPQKMEGQEIRLKAVISRMGKLTVEKNRYYSAWKTRSYWKTRNGGILFYDKIRRDVTDMNENPDRVVRPILKAGEEKGTTDIVLDAEEHFPIHAGASFDNQGVKLTGKDRPGFTIRNNNMLGLDDIFMIGTTFGNAFGALYLYHVIPVSNFGTKFIWSISHAQVNPKKEFKIFGINGTSETYSLALQQRLIRTEKYSGNIQLGFDFKEKHTSTQSVTTVWDKERVLSIKGDLQSRDRWGGWSLGSGVSFGMPNRGDGWPLASREGVHAFFKYNYSLTRVTQLPFRTRLIWDVQGQFTPDRLLPQEQLFLGGARSIRGYPESDYGADQGFQSRLDYLIPVYGIPAEWKMPYDTVPLKDQVSIITFCDTGYGRAHGATGTEKEDDFLMGVGGGFELRFRKSLSARLEWGVPIGDNPITEAGHSQLHFTFSANY